MIDSIMLPPIQCIGCTDNHTHIECRCNGWYRFREHICAPYPEHYIIAANRYDSDGYPICRYCGKVRFNLSLVQCPSCSKFFKGPRQYFPVDYECPDCE